MKIFFQTDLQARLTLLCNGSGHIGTKGFFTKVITNYRSRGYVSMTIKKMTAEQEGLYTSSETGLFIRYEFLRIILLSSYGNLQKAAAEELDGIRDQIPPRPILREHLIKEMKTNKNGVSKIIMDIFWSNDLYQNYHYDWVMTLHGEKDAGYYEEFYLDLFKKSLHIESTISMKTLIKDNKVFFRESDAKAASELTLEGLCMSQDSLTQENNQKLAVTFLLMDGYISEYTDTLNKMNDIIRHIMLKTGSKTVQFIEYFIYLLDNGHIETTADMLKDMLEKFLINTFHLLKHPTNTRVFQIRRGEMMVAIWDQWMGKCEELIQDYRDDFCRFFANLLIINHYYNPIEAKGRDASNMYINLGLATISKRYIEVSTHPTEIESATLNNKTFSMCRIGSQSYIFNQHMTFLLENIDAVRPSWAHEYTNEARELLFYYCYTVTVQPASSPIKRISPGKEAPAEVEAEAEAEAEAEVPKTPLSFGLTSDGKKIVSKMAANMSGPDAENAPGSPQGLKELKKQVYALENPGKQDIEGIQRRILRSQGSPPYKQGLHGRSFHDPEPKKK